MAKKDFIHGARLGKEQEEILNNRNDSSFIVKGCAGSGKSLLALLKAKQIQDSNLGTVLFVVKTNSLKQYMADAIRTFGINVSSVETFNKCFYFTKVDGKWIRGAWKKGDYDFIIVDEAQDLTKDDILFLKNKAKKAIFYYGDSAQQLYDFDKTKEPVTMEDIAYFTRFPTEQLVFNYRLPKKIAKVAEYVNSENDRLVTRCVEEGYESPFLQEYNSFEEEMDAYIRIKRNRNFEDVGILFRKDDDVKRAYEYLKEKGENVEARYYGGAVDDLDFKSGNTKIMNYHNAKGLQFEAVFLPECYCSDNGSRNALYVAITRTYRSLYIMHTGRLSDFLDDVPRTLFEQTNNTEEL